jgi:hypothetical protein
MDGATPIMFVVRFTVFTCVHHDVPDWALT